MDRTDKNGMPLPSFSGSRMPMNVAFNSNEDDVLEETTRRVECVAPQMTPVDFTVPPSLENSSTFSTPTTKRTYLHSQAAPWQLFEVPCVPEFQPLEPTSTFVPHIGAFDVATRISQILKERNIQADYVDNEAECLTFDNVEFSVYLYQGKKKYSHGIVVEVQRLSGNSLNFYNDVKAILDGAQLNQEERRQIKRTKIATPLVSDDDESDDEDSPASSLDFTIKMLEGGLDVQLLGLQTLSSMTDASKMGSRIAAATSLKVISGNQVIFCKVSDIVSHSDEQNLIMQAMILLSNVARFTTLPLKNSKKDLIKLLNSDRPQLAYLAAKCFKTNQVDSVIADALHEAKKLGQLKNHPGLAECCTNLLEHTD
mmetsp:Transcript_24798/g.36700  ORF Transcript_24798/g.36700 Transcript_24798/m.36700 type:complete len:369 (+) Transcript_24798:109-1215(+)|eukprot:CAMPEP_0194256862 /NCGR_PEP_ID=MMETSP0158-20130606/37692_1 /TAXON_ID=33649 /ORGANISM="Thalassionema nitzschioides, Strain L26-B" /LENGTH=368 /DNA_ID=CAMNT_0038995705 /DNA_START=128 /DNA_END=1234 /DNA_ORIENTATION=+